MRSWPSVDGPDELCCREWSAGSEELPSGEGWTSSKRDVCQLAMVASVVLVDRAQSFQNVVLDISQDSKRDPDRSGDCLVSFAVRQV